MAKNVLYDSYKNLTEFSSRFPHVIRLKPKERSGGSILHRFHFS